MPSNERVRPSRREGSPPVDQPRQGDECDARRVIGPPRPDLAFECTTPTAFAGTGSRRRVARAAATSTTRIGGRHQRRAQTCTTPSRTQASVMPWILPSWMLVQIGCRHKNTLNDRFRRAHRVPIFGSKFVPIQLLRTTRTGKRTASPGSVSSVAESRGSIRE
jgi:hypothetical protein